MQPTGSEEPKGLQEGAKMEPKSPDLGFWTRGPRDFSRGLRDFSRGLRDFGENPEGPAPRTDFGAILGAPLGPVWAHFRHHFFDVFLNGFLMALASIWGPKTPPK